MNVVSDSDLIHLATDPSSDKLLTKNIEGQEYFPTPQEASPYFSLKRYMSKNNLSFEEISLDDPLLSKEVFSV